MSKILRPYQVAGVAFLTSRRGAILADQVGLGKTFEAISAVLQIRAKSVLLLCPLHLKDWWEQEITSVEMSSGASSVERQVLFGKSPSLTFTLPDGARRVWLIVHPEQLQNNSPSRDLLLRASWGVVVVDECHKFANRKAQRTANLFRLKAYRRYGLTGTPMRDKPQDLWALLHWVDPVKWHSYWKFIDTYLTTVSGYWGGREITGVKNLPQLQRETAPYLLIRSREDVGMELPPISIETAVVSLEPKQQKLYDQMQNQMVVELRGVVEAEGLSLESLPEQLIISNGLARFVRLQECASIPHMFDVVDSAKVEWLRNYLDEGGEPAVIMSRFRRAAEVIRHVVGDGASKWVVGTYDSLSLGLNLQQYNIFIAWDCPFSRNTWEQAVGRLYRPGQTRPVQVYRLTGKDTVDEDVIETLARKESDVQMVLRWLRRAFHEG